MFQCGVCGKEFDSVHLYNLHINALRKCVKRDPCPFVTYRDLLDYLIISEYKDLKWSNINYANVIYNLYCMLFMGDIVYIRDDVQTVKLNDALSSTLSNKFHYQMVNDKHVIFVLYNPTIDELEAVENTFLVKWAEHNYGLRVSICMNGATNEAEINQHRLVGTGSIMRYDTAAMSQNIVAHFRFIRMCDRPKRVYKMMPHQNTFIYHNRWNTCYAPIETILLQQMFCHNDKPKILIVCKIDKQIVYDIIMKFKDTYYGLEPYVIHMDHYDSHNEMPNECISHYQICISHTLIDGYDYIYSMDADAEANVYVNCMDNAISWNFSDIMNVNFQSAREKCLINDINEMSIYDKYVTRPIRAIYCKKPLAIAKELATILCIDKGKLYSTNDEIINELLRRLIKDISKCSLCEFMAALVTQDTSDALINESKYNAVETHIVIDEQILNLIGYGNIVATPKRIVEYLFYEGIYNLYNVNDSTAMFVDAEYLLYDPEVINMYLMKMNHPLKNIIVLFAKYTMDIRFDGIETIFEQQFLYINRKPILKKKIMDTISNMGNEICGLCESYAKIRQIYSISDNIIFDMIVNVLYNINIKSDSFKKYNEYLNMCGECQYSFFDDYLVG